MSIFVKGTPSDSPTRPTSQPDIIQVYVSNAWEFAHQCALCGEFSLESHAGRTGDHICADCCETFWESWEYARSGEYPWSRTQSVKASSRASIPPALRRAIFERDGYRCRYCGGYHGGLVLEHVMPWSRGGTDTADNLVTACVPCNQKKSNRTPDEAGMPLLEVQS